jgi:two-component sensor histidine kinase
LEPFSKRATIAGASIMLPAQMAQNLTLVLHELATNSAKYGALSTDTGKIAVFWTVERNASGSVLKFKWQESGGPRVVPPVRHGFGTKLLKAVFSEMRLQYPAEGLKYEIDEPPNSPLPSQPVLAENAAALASG